MARLRIPTLQAGILALGFWITSVAWAQEEPPRERQRLDPASGQWTPAAPEHPGTPDAEMRRARQRLIDGEPRKAEGVLKKWRKDNPAHERYYEAVFLQGESEFDARDYFAAYELYEEVVVNTSGELYRRALQREMDVARAFLSGQPRILWKTVRVPAQDDGIEILDRIWERVPGTRLGEEALLLKANYFFDSGQADLAQDEYALLAKEYPKGRYRQMAMLRSAEAAERAFPGVRFDDRPLLNADTRYRQVEDSYPAYAERERVPARRAAIRDQRASKDLEVGDWYQRTGNTGAASYYYRAVLKDWPDTFAAAEARTRLLSLGYDVESMSPTSQGATKP